METFQVEERRDKALEKNTPTIVKLLDRYRFLELLPCPKTDVERYLDQLTGWSGGVELATKKREVATQESSIHSPQLHRLVWHFFLGEARRELLTIYLFSAW